MFTRVFKATAVALAASGLVSAQTHTDCNPMKKSKSEPACHSRFRVESRLLTRLPQPARMTLLCPRP